MTAVSAQVAGASAAASGRSGGEPREPGSLLARLVWSRDLGARRVGFSLIAVLLLAYGAMFYRWLDKQLGPGGEVLGIDFGRGSLSFNAFEDWGHAYVIPLIAGAYVWTRRDQLRPELARTFWPGLVPLVLGLVIYAYFSTVRPIHMFQGGAMILSLMGLTILLLGPHLFRPLLFPLAYLSLGVTIAEQIMLAITWPLKQLASIGGHMMLNLIQIDNTLQGTVLTVYSGSGESFPLDVADACSGMRMVVAFVALSVAVAFFSCREWWQRAAVMLIAVPVALFMNVVRVAVLAALTLQDPDLAVGGAHSLIGTLLLIPAFGIFMLFVWIFKHATPEREAAGS